MLNYKPLIPCVFILTILFLLTGEIYGHGMMLDPVSRSSRWRYDKTAPINYDDNGLFCGGFGVQWFSNNGKCGLCGDDYAAPRPRENELGGKYGKGVITGNYLQSQNVRIGVKITTNHLGFFYFHICNLDKFKEESEDCFNANKIKFSDGNFKMYIGTKSGMIYPNIILPKGLNCKHCVLRWSYQAGNNWGPCGNGTSALGCGPQENFKGCSDIKITNTFSNTKKDRQRKRTFIQKIINQNVYSDYDVNFMPIHDVIQPKKPVDFNFYNQNEIYNPFISKIEEKKDFDMEEVMNPVDNKNYEFTEEEESDPYLVKDVFYKGEDVTFDKELLNGVDNGLFEAPEYVQEDETEMKRDSVFSKLNDLFKFDHENRRNNALDDGFYDFEDF
ncbi:uncharacterized protein LOC129915641 [Episyrphus balteatus]|uniref:uncharacterized protein LOC129915641 n=1 Tax=Episyrphus balteatus TaxID=286459 RepID=UPI00248506F7|nr:uncharacterized protein LOC129915641 [Episyrphus balteatus]